MYSHSSEVLKLMETADEYERETKLRHIYNVLLKYEKIEAEKKSQKELEKAKPIKRIKK